MNQQQSGLGSSFILHPSSLSQDWQIPLSLVLCTGRGRRPWQFPRTTVLEQVSVVMMPQPLESRRRFIKQLADGENIEEVFLVVDKQLRANRNGNLYLQMEL